MKKTNTKQLALLGVLAALTIIISFIPIRSLGLEITLSMVPVAVGAVILGPAGGAALGGVFGVVSFIQCVSAYSPFGATLLAIDPIKTAITCIPTRILAGLLAGLFAKLLSKKFNNAFPTAVCCISAAVLNTVFFMSSIVLFFYRSDFIQGFVEQLGAANPFIFVVLFVGINGLVEIIAGTAIALPIGTAVKKYMKL